MNDFARSMMRDSRRGDRRGYRDSGIVRYEYEGRGNSMSDHRRGRDYDYARDYGYDDMRMGDGNYEHEYDMRRGDRGYDYGYDYERGDMRRGYDRRNDYGDYARRRDRRGRFMRDRGEHGLEFFSMEDVENWKHEMKNEDGSHGEHFNKEQVKQAAQMAGIDMHELGEIPFCLAMNMKYSDYCKVAQKYGVDRPDFYADMAKAFLKDKDFDGEPEEKLYLYYKCIVEKE